ncbi:MAG: hypothetical protein D3923_03100 [Candidatus Electrothrix sp. AR3]|nr:hypothetical protein [Candidatus Electrothrix sp. AR3]
MSLPNVVQLHKLKLNYLIVVMNKNKKIARRYFLEIMNLAKLDTLYELLAPDFVFTASTLPEPCKGPDRFKELVKMLHCKVPDFYIHVQDMVADGDAVVTRWRGGGTHTDGSLLYTAQGDIAPSVSRFEFDGVTWHKMKDGRIVESTADEDTAGLMTQLGVLPAQPVVPPDEEVNQAVVRRYFNEVMNQGKLDAVDEIVDPHFHFIVQAKPEPFRGTEGLKGFVCDIRRAFPDIRFEINEAIVEEDKVVVRRKVGGTHKEELFGVAPTEQFIEASGIEIFTLCRGRILTVHANGNDFGLTLQAGLMTGIFAS